MVSMAFSSVAFLARKINSIDGFNDFTFRRNFMLFSWISNSTIIMCISSFCMKFIVLFIESVEWTVKDFLLLSAFINASQSEVCDS